MSLSKDNIDNYFMLIKNLDNTDKLKLIAKITESILENNNNEDIIIKCFGKVETEESAEELINNIYNARSFRDKDLSL